MDFLFGRHHNIDELYCTTAANTFSKIFVYFARIGFCKKVRKKCAKINIKIAVKQ